MTDFKRVLNDNNFRFNKRFGQNFLSDGELLEKIAEDAGVTENDNVLEIGAGAGSLTQVLAKRAKRVVAFEIDENLKDVLKETVGEFGNVEVKIADFMRWNESEISALFDGEPFKVVANIPYYITTPIIMKLLESDLAVESVTVMIQKEVAERLAAKPGTAEYGVITVAVDLVGNAKVMRVVDKSKFYPVPKVDSAVVKIDVIKGKYGVDYASVMKVVKSAFAMRRKTLANNLMSSFGMTRESVNAVLEAEKLSLTIRGEVLSTSDFISLSKRLGILK